MTDQTVQELQEEIDSLRVDLQGREDELRCSMEEGTRLEAKMEKLTDRLSRLEDEWGRTSRQEASFDSGLDTRVTYTAKVQGTAPEVTGGDWTPPRSILKRKINWIPQAQSTAIKGDTTPPVEAFEESPKHVEPIREREENEDLDHELRGKVASKETPWPLKRDQRIVGQEQLRERLQRGAGRPRIVPDRFSDKQPWVDYKEHFESCKLVNGWDDEEASVFLAASLQGPALKVLIHHGSGEKKRHTYSELLKLLDGRFGPGERAENFLLELRNRRQGPKETIQELGQAVRELAAFSYPEFTETARDRLARGHFSDAIASQSIREGVFRANPSTLDEAIRAALATENFEKIEAQRSGTKFGLGRCRMLDNTPEEAALQSTGQKMHQTEEEAGQTPRRRDTRVYRFRPGRPATQGDRCYNCQRNGHFARECPEKNNTHGRPGNANQPVLRPEEGLEPHQGPPAI